MSKVVRPNIIVAFYGYKTSGKDTAAESLVTRLYMTMQNPLILRRNFADPVKSICRTLFGLTSEEMNDQALKEKVLDRWPYQSPRHIMQHFATDYARKFYPDIWVQHWERGLAACNADFIILTDLRFPNEYDILKKRGAVIVEVDRPGIVKNDTHESESYYKTFKPHVLLCNDGTKEQLQETARTVLTEILKEVYRDRSGSQMLSGRAN